MNSIKDYLTELHDLKRPATIRFRPIDGGVVEIKGHITKVEEVSGRIIVETDEGFVIGDDQILEVNGRNFENIC